MFCSKCGAENKEGSNYCSSCGAYISPKAAGPEAEVRNISIPYPGADSLHLIIRVGACRLKISPGHDESWVTGSYQCPAGALQLKIDKRGGRVTITQDYDVIGLGGLFRYAPRLELVLGTARACALTLEGGASDFSVDLGGIPLNQLAIKQGAGRAELDFSAPNPQEMSSLTVASGAVSLQMKNLANAHFVEMTFDGGAASYRFDFGGLLQRDARAKISTSMAPVEIRIPSGTAARVVENTVMASLDLGDGFMKKGGAFLTEAALAGKTPALSIQANISLGSLALRTV